MVSTNGSSHPGSSSDGTSGPPPVATPGAPLPTGIELKADWVGLDRAAGFAESVGDHGRGIARHFSELAEYRPLQHGLTDDTWNQFAATYVPNARTLADTVSQFSGILESLGDQIHELSDGYRRTEEAATETARSLSRPPSPGPAG